MTQEQEQFAVDLTDNAKTHEDWLAIVNFGMRQLLTDSGLLMELIVREATRWNKQRGMGGRVVADDAREILAQLGLRLVPAPPPTKNL
jgi:hypothetical protein